MVCNLFVKMEYNTSNEHSFSLVYNNLNPRIIVFSFHKMSSLNLSRVQVVFLGVHLVALQCFYRNPERTNQSLTVERVYQCCSRGGAGEVEVRGVQLFAISNLMARGQYISHTEAICVTMTDFYLQA